MDTSYLITIKGIVQGIGFRPFVYNLAKKLNLKGWILNNSNGVLIHLEGSKVDIKEFILILKTDPPHLSLIKSINLEEISSNNYTTFEIKESQKTTSSQIFISPDVCTCDDCKNDILDLNNKRFLYPFTNCTNCGPRFSIIKEVPYDRNVTTMDKFKQCHHCYEEYKNKDDRRFHAQPNCCPICGPKISINDNNGIDITSTIIGNSKINSSIYNEKIINFFEDMINDGYIFAMKSLSGFHLCCTPYSYDAVNKLRKRKDRKTKPFALMMKDITTVKKYCYINENEERLLLNNSRPIVLLRKKENLDLPLNLSPNNNYLGVMLPSTPLQILIFEKTNLDSLIMTSGNLSGLPLEYENEKAIKNLSHFCDYYLLNDRDIFLPLDDSIVKETPTGSMIVRRSRGYCPLPLTFDNLGEILALGGDMKNTFAISKGDYVYMGPHNGELINYESFERFKSNISHYKKLFEISPTLITCDLHPGYESSQYAKEFNLPLVKVQHHHAHIVSCMVDNNYNDKVIGVAFDGTGYGDDNAIWGSEFLLCDFKNYRRVGHLNYVKFLGGDKSLRDGYKIALSYLYNLDSSLTSSLLSTNYPSTYDMIFKLLSNPNSSYPSSSMGRLFDGVASLLGLCHTSSFEGEGAIILESILKDPILSEGYPFTIENTNGSYLLSPIEIVNHIVRDINNSLPKEEISLRFHSTIVNYIIKMCEILRENYNINVVALSGGVFQNTFLLDNTYTELNKIGFKVLIHKNIPTNDGGISLGQLVIAKNNK